MVNEKFRKALDAYADDMEQEIKILDNHAYDNSIVGVTEDGRLIYDYEKMIEEYIKDEDCSDEDAIEWLDYNTLRAIPYMGEDAPIIIHHSVENIMDMYGE